MGKGSREHDFSWRVCNDFNNLVFIDTKESVKGRYQVKIGKIRTSCGM